jgi:hypothetical protein
MVAERIIIDCCSGGRRDFPAGVPPLPCERISHSSQQCRHNSCNREAAYSFRYAGCWWFACESHLIDRMYYALRYTSGG